MSKKLMRKKLAMMLATLKKKRKFFCEVEYLESTGSQWIDTGINTTALTSWDVGCAFTSTTAARYMGAIKYDGSLYNRSNFGISGSSQFATYYGVTGTISHTWTTGVDTNYHRYRLEVGTNAVAYFDNNSYAFTKGEYDAGLNFWLFARNCNVDAYKSYCNARIYFAKIFNDNGVLVRDFIPVLDWNMTPCMYDKVTGQLFHNAGTGDFTAGREIHYVDYLESTGTQYIDTGLTYFADFEIGIKLRENVSNKALGNGASYCMQRNNATSPYWQFTSGGTSNYYNTTVSITKYHVMKWKDNKIYADDAFITSLTKSLNSNNPMLLFGAGGQKFQNIIYFCKLWNDNGTLVRDFIPAIDENDTYFMFDKVSHTCYNNAGSGSFIGPTVSKDGNGKIIENEYE